MTFAGATLLSPFMFCRHPLLSPPSYSLPDVHVSKVCVPLSLAPDLKSYPIIFARCFVCGEIHPVHPCKLHTKPVYLSNG